MDQPLSITTILVPLDGSTRAEQALPYAAAIGGLGGEIVVLAVAPRATSVRNVLGREIAPADRVQEGYERVARETLARAVAALPGGAAVRRELAAGDAAEEIVRIADEVGAGLIVMTALGRGSFGGWALGSTADRVARAARRPVMIVHRQAPGAGLPRVSGLIAPVDGSASAARALPVAAALARALDVGVRVVHAVELDEALLDAVEVDGYDPRASRYEDAEVIADEAVAVLGQAGVRATGEVLTGEPASTIVSAARPDEVVVLASHGQAGEGRWRLGGVADKLLRHGAVSVVLVPAA